MRNLYHVPVTQEHLDAGQDAIWQNRGGNVEVIPHERRVLSRAALDALRAQGEPVAAVYAGFGHTTVVLNDGQELAYYWCDDGIALMAACDNDRAAEMEPQTVQLMDLLTYGAYCASRPSSDDVFIRCVMVRDPAIGGFQFRMRIANERLS